MANVLGTLSMEDLGNLRRMKPADAAIFLSGHTLTHDEQVKVDKIIGRDLPEMASSMVIQVQDPSRPLWVLAAWMAGASWRQIAKLHGVASQTIMAAADRLLVSSQRAPQRLRVGMSLEALDTYRKSFVNNLDKFRLMTPQEVAQWLLDNTELDND